MTVQILYYKTIQNYTKLQKITQTYIKLYKTTKKYTNYIKLHAKK